MSNVYKTCNKYTYMLRLKPNATNICAFSLLLHPQSADVRVCQLQQKLLDGNKYFRTSTSTSTGKLYLSTDQVPVQVPSTTRLIYLHPLFIRARIWSTVGGHT